MPYMTLRPNAAGTLTQLTPSAGDNYAAVDEVTPDEAGTTVYSTGGYGSTITGTDLYNLPASGGSGAIGKVTVYYRIYSNYGPTRNGSSALRTNSANHYGTYNAATSDWTTWTEEYALNPETSAAWTWDEIDALEIGVRLSAGSAEEEAVTVYCTQVYVIIAHSAIVTPTTLALAITLYDAVVTLAKYATPTTLALALITYTPSVSIGSIYIGNYSLVAEEHQFFAKSLRKGLVVPNKITVQSYPDDTDQYTGNYTDSTSYALLPIEVTIRAKLTSNAQATSIATAMIANLVMEQQKGTAKIPMDCIIQPYDYVKVTDAWENDTRVGNIGYINGKTSTWEMTFGFGRQRLVAVGGARTSRGMLYPFIPDRPNPNDKVTYGFFDDFKNRLYDQMDVMVDVINTLVAFKHWWETSDDAVDATKLAEAVGDLEGQIDAIDVDSASVSEPTRAKDTIYQNTSGKLRLVVVTVRVNESAASFRCDTASTPTTQRCYAQTAGTDNIELTMTWIIPPDWYYRVYEVSGTITIMEWHEADLY